MSRIGKEPVQLAEGVTAGIAGQKVTVKGKLGELSYVMHDGVAAKVEGEKVLVPGTTVICALGQRPRWNVVEELRDCAPWVRVIGDANAVGTITKATYQGHHAALDI